MADISIVVLELPNGKVAFQRRDDKAQQSPGRLGLFGGHVEKGEDPAAAMVRELNEETSLPINQLQYIGTFKLETYDGPDKENTYYLYKMGIADMSFGVFEGVGAEAYSIEEALARDDLTNSAEYSLKERYAAK